MRSTDEHPLVTPESHIRPGSGEQFRQLRSLINNIQGIKELLLFQPTGYSETLGSIFAFRTLQSDKNLPYYATISKVLS